jgi:hypothetical protein
MTYDEIGLNVPTILFPQKGIDLTKWSVVACDQYTSQPEYWEDVRKKIGHSPSTLNLIFPEVFLGKTDEAATIKKINASMEACLSEEVLCPLDKGLVLVDRKTPFTPSRKGLVVALDLECYDYQKGAKSLIRATEGTVIERLPPRIRIRQHAKLELPHIMILIDDPEDTVIGPLFKKNLPELYNFELMMKGNHLKGYTVSDPALIEGIASALEKLASVETQQKKYGPAASEKGILLYAVGDGNHSLATAKSIWDTLKKASIDKKKIMNHPARYALVELVNIHDKGLEFESIHRLVLKTDMSDLLGKMKSFCEKKGQNFSFSFYSTLQEARAAAVNEPNIHRIALTTKDKYGVIEVRNAISRLDVGTLQTFLDDYMAGHPKTEIDYIHGDDVLAQIVHKENGIGFFLSVLPKNELFKTVLLEGALPRKAFSMGEAQEKRFYLEARKIVT